MFTARTSFWADSSTFGPRRQFDVRRSMDELPVIVAAPILAQPFPKST
jgi:hypothetical protein